MQSACVQSTWTQHAVYRGLCAASTSFEMHSCIYTHHRIPQICLPFVHANIRYIVGRDLYAGMWYFHVRLSLTNHCHAVSKCYMCIPRMANATVTRVYLWVYATFPVHQVLENLTGNKQYKTHYMYIVLAWSTEASISYLQCSITFARVASPIAGVRMGISAVITVIFVNHWRLFSIVPINGTMYNCAYARMWLLYKILLF